MISIIIIKTFRNLKCNSLEYALRSQMLKQVTQKYGHCRSVQCKKKQQKTNQRKINYPQTAILFYAAKKSFNSINVCTILINDLMKKKKTKLIVTVKKLIVCHKQF